MIGIPVLILEFEKIVWFKVEHLQLIELIEKFAIIFSCLSKIVYNIWSGI